MAPEPAPAGPASMVDGETALVVNRGQQGQQAAKCQCQAQAQPQATPTPTLKSLVTDESTAVERQFPARRFSYGASPPHSCPRTWSVAAACSRSARNTTNRPYPNSRNIVIFTIAGPVTVATSTITSAIGPQHHPVILHCCGKDSCWIPFIATRDSRILASQACELPRSSDRIAQVATERRARQPLSLWET
ncbi:hypothetical protein HYALB_00006719 [Hymenoscyphus albidus]|uniref:Uncharacterized protein n=1 Tax=Hymenoscyphus albidus TaxID=595503 RepID=A0A9N9LRC3_9HELO|nr:hypothetical protein HYALB_00006719 [Hymenoscyphus albidus]